MRLLFLNLLLPIFAFCLMQPQALAKGVYLETNEFLAQAFAESPEQDMLWLNTNQRSAAKEILGHTLEALRVRYWSTGARTAWVFDEIGKERPITIGVVVQADRIVTVAILAFRESRGGEVRYPFFTNQFVGQELTQKNKLSGHVDGITGATLSVWAVANVSRLALYFHQQVRPNDVAANE